MLSHLDWQFKVQTFFPLYFFLKMSQFIIYTTNTRSGLFKDRTLKQHRVLSVSCIWRSHFTSQPHGVGEVCFSGHVPSFLLQIYTRERFSSLLWVGELP